MQSFSSLELLADLNEDDFQFGYLRARQNKLETEDAALPIFEKENTWDGGFVDFEDLKMIKHKRQKHDGMGLFVGEYMRL